ncbi:MAG: biotin-dependent carboxyltransferase [Candidatus Rokubacteria bacterium]|nr:biotin-dependent carboxyltransferase [Candidatus Rokubacteria bacterium]
MNGFVVVQCGALTTVQDLGRPGYLRYGIPPSGPLDRASFLLANRLVGNADSAAALECTLMGPWLEMRGESVIAVTGADVPVTVNGREVPRWTSLPVSPGDVVKLGVARRGLRAYVAFRGGIDVPLALGSRATYLRGTLGGFQGRQFRDGDQMDLLPPAEGIEPVRARRVRPEMIPSWQDEVEVRVVLGPQAERFTRAGIDAFLGEPYEMTTDSDRMGARLQGPAITHSRGHDLVSDGIPLGGIQVVGDGQPIILLVDRQSTGGYTKLATVCSFDIGKVGQTKPRQRLRFKSLTVPEAHTLLRQEFKRLQEALL